MFNFKFPLLHTAIADIVPRLPIKTGIGRRSSGFTLIEIIVAGGMFSVVIVLVVGIFSQFTQTHRRDIADQALQEDLRFGLELFNREARTGYGDTFRLTDATGGSIVFRNQNGICVNYRYNDREQRLSRAQWEQSGDSCTLSGFVTERSYQDVTGSNVAITSLRFDPTPSDVVGGKLQNQGFITIVAIATPASYPSSSISMQSTIASRQVIPFEPL